MDGSTIETNQPPDIGEVIQDSPSPYELAVNRLKQNLTPIRDILQRQIVEVDTGENLAQDNLTQILSLLDSEIYPEQLFLREILGDVSAEEKVNILGS